MARKMSSKEYQELGRRYYKINQYEKAIETLTQGIESMPTVGLYDHRAASYDKLKDFNAAVKDGREMIKLDKTEIRGYLRTASVLEKMDKPDTALGIYKYGMKHIPTSDRNFKLLQQLHDKLTRKLSPPQSLDPFTIFPTELAEMVFSYLTFRQMVNCMRVSRGWRDYLAKLSNLWLHLDLSGARKLVRRSFVGSAVRCSQNRLTRFTVHRFDHMDVLKNIAKDCKSLQELEIITLPYKTSSTLLEVVQIAASLKKLVLHPEVTLDTATNILNFRPDLECVKYSAIQSSNNISDWKGPFNGLKTFSARSTNTTAALQFGFRMVILRVPFLQSLTLDNIINLDHVWPGWRADSTHWPLPPLKELILRDVRFEGFPILPPTLERLHVSYAGSFSLFSEFALMHSCVPYLTDLRLWGFDDLCDVTSLFNEDLAEKKVLIEAAGVIPPSDGPVPLHSISLRGLLRDAVRPQNDGLFHGPSSLFGYSPRFLTPKLRSLDVSSLPCDDDEIEHLLTYDLALESIDLSSTQITGASIKMLADKLPTLKSIKADHCRKISGRDAIHYAERKGISVSYRMEEHNGERRVRYG